MSHRYPAFLKKAAYFASFAVCSARKFLIIGLFRFFRLFRNSILYFIGGLRCS